MLIPFWGLAIGRAAQEGFACFASSAGSRRRSMIFAWGILTALFVVTGINGFSYQARQFSRPLGYSTICEEIGKHVPKGSRALGPGQFWLGLRGLDWRDSNMLIFERWLTNSSSHVPDALARTEADYLLADRQLIGVMNRLKPKDAKRLRPLEFIAEIPGETKDESYALFKVKKT
ncbi:MAG: hypothetical protein HY548_05990 [Elusimicrobia bacterium]|nr:hypothetical protein [Elusimicrobiota bacterium]